MNAENITNNPHSKKNPYFPHLGHLPRIPSSFVKALQNLTEPTLPGPLTTTFHGLRLRLSHYLCNGF